MSSARAVSALPHRDISSAWAWLFWAFGCCRDSLAGLLTLLCLMFPLPYPHTEAPHHIHTLVHGIRGMSPLKIWMQRLFPIHSESENNRLTPESRARKNTWVFHKFWTRIGVFNCARAHCRSQPKWLGRLTCTQRPPVSLPHGQASSGMLCYNFAGKCITGLTEICKHQIPLDLSGQGNFPVFPEAPGPDDGNQPHKASGVLPCWDA